MDHQGWSYWDYPWCGRIKTGYFVCNMILLGWWPFMDESISNCCSPVSDMSYGRNTICCCSCCRCYCKQCLILVGICPNIVQRAQKLRIIVGTHILGVSSAVPGIKSPCSHQFLEFPFQSISRNPTFPRCALKIPISWSQRDTSPLLSLWHLAPKPSIITFRNWPHCA